jgi:ubiquinone/menaquinone biosynthesis C-methylase UbiE
MRQSIPERHAEVSEFFDALASDYDQTYESESVGGRILRRRLETVLELLGDDPGDVLDAGMGSGVLCERLDAAGWTLTGVDISPAMVELARARLPHLVGRLRHGSVLDLTFAEASFDAAVCTGVLEYVEDDLANAIGELARVVRPGGTVVVSLPNYSSMQGIGRFRIFYPSVRQAKHLLGRTPPPARRIVTLRQLEDTLSAVGLSVVTTEVIGMRLLPRRLGSRIERSRSPVARLFGTQFVLLAVKQS